jgi:Aspartyl protease
MPSFAIQAPDLRHLGPVIDAEIAIATFDVATLEASGIPLPAPIRVRALIDTGASVSVMRQGIGALLGLSPDAIRLVDTATSSHVRCEAFAVSFHFSPEFAVDVTALEMPLHGNQIDCLIGRDILARGVFIYLGSGNAFTLSI